MNQLSKPLSDLCVFFAAGFFAAAGLAAAGLVAAALAVAFGAAAFAAELFVLAEPFVGADLCVAFAIALPTPLTRSFRISSSA
jgi:hypothetical protein